MKRGIACFLSALISVTSVTSVCAGAHYSKIKDFILSGEGYDASLDTNGNGTVDVLDICREKSKILYPEKWKTDEPSPAPTAVQSALPSSEPSAVPSEVPSAEPSQVPSEEPSSEPAVQSYSFLSLGMPVIDEEENALYLPVDLEKTYFDITSLTFSLEWDSEHFELNNFDPADFYGSWSWGYCSGFATVEFITDDNLSGGGNLLCAKFDLLSAADGKYSFRIIDVSAAAEVDGAEVILSEEECPPDSPVYTFEIKQGLPVSAPSSVPSSDPSSVPSAEPSVNPGYSEPVPNTPSVEEQEAYNAMIALKSQYPEGMSWTNDNYYGWNGGIYTGGYGCAGFAFMLSDAAFGKLPAKMKYDYSVSEIRVGDILRMNGDSHSVIVLSVESNGVTVAEGNYNSSVHWGRKIPVSELNRLTYIITRYPD